MKGWPERWPQEHRAAQDHWAALHFNECLVDGNIAFTGDVRSRLKIGGAWGEQTFRVAIVYPPGFPYRQPYVSFIKPGIKYSRHLQGREPCLFPAEDWDPTVPPSEIYKKLIAWLRGYRTGVWDNDLPIYELPAYYGRAEPDVLVGDGALASMVGRATGTFALQRFVGHSVAVLASIDSAPVGRELIADLRLKTSEKINGHWYRLSKEPEAMHDEQHLRAVMARDGHNLRVDKKPTIRRVGLVFTDDQLDTEHLLLLEFGRESSKTRRAVPKGWAVRSLPVHLAGHAEIFKRLDGIHDIKALDDRRVTILGCGAIGSHAAKALCREGVGEFRLGDPDRLKPGNVVRHALDLTAVGRRKAEALSDALHQINPHCHAEAVVTRLSEPDSLEQHIADSDVVVAAIGDDFQEELLSEIAVTVGSTPLVLVRTVHVGSAYRVCLMRPGRDACMTCMGLHRGEGHTGWITVPDDDLQPIYDNGCASPSRPGAGIASEQAALRAAEVVLELLEGEDGDTNHWLTVRQAITGGDSRLEERGTIASVLAPHTGCQWCAA